MNERLSLKLLAQERLYRKRFKKDEENWRRVRLRMADDLGRQVAALVDEVTNYPGCFTGPEIMSLFVLVQRMEEFKVSLEK